MIKFSQPLAEKMRPECLADFFGQEFLLGENAFLTKAIKADEVPSMILWGPPGSGKTTLAMIIARLTKAEFVQLSAVSSGKKDLQKVIETAREKLVQGQKTILFVDEIHRWNKAQQDALLPCVEKGSLIFIGATTENPSFEVNSALLSRARVFVFNKLCQEALVQILKKALADKQKGLGNKKIEIEKELLFLMARLSNGDARMALNILQAVSSQSNKITKEAIHQVLQKAHILYDKNGDEHYNIISALHKSMRGGDANAAVYWLARMLEGGEDPVYIARRLVHFASEDVGLSDNHALILTNAVFDACHKLGMPECAVHLAQAVIYLSKTKKSILAYNAYNQAKADVFEFGNLSVPLHIRNAPTKLMKNLGYGKDYKYTPLEDSSEQKYLPKELENRKYM